MKPNLLIWGRLKPIAFGLLTLALLLFAAASAFAQTGGGYDLSWNTFDGGGAAFSTGGGYSLGGTIGQPDAETLTATLALGIPIHV